MEREIIFRGKGKFTGKWIEGYYVKIGETDYICTGEVAENNHLNDYGLICCSPAGHAVDPDTVGQYTGLTDKNGKKIFDGDILLIGKGTIPVVVEFSADYDLSWECVTKNIGEHYRHRLEYDSLKYEVIGNRWDNPELLEVKK